MHDLTGRWDGTFAYPGIEQTTPFLAEISEAGGRFTGSIIEPHVHLAGSVGSTIAGVRSGAVVDFTKTYPPDRDFYTEPVEYAGRLSEDGNRIEGVWMLQDLTGPFEMVREVPLAAPLEAEVAEEVKL